MPIYEYRCASCGFQKEYLQKMGATPLTQCPACGESSYGKMVTAAGFHLKGSGWYATDFKHGAKPQPKAEDAPAAKPDEQPAAKSEQQATPKSDDKASQPATPAQEAVVKKPDAPAAAKTSGADTVGS